MKKLNTLIILSILSMSSGLAFSHTADTTDIEVLMTKWAMSFGQGKTDALMALYAENAMEESRYEAIYHFKCRFGYQR